jgi:hypothetical protein
MVEEMLAVPIFIGRGAPAHDFTHGAAPPRALPSLDAYDMRTYGNFASAGRAASAERDSPACLLFVDFHRRTSFAPHSADLGRVLEGGFVVFQPVLPNRSLARGVAP